MSIIAFWNDSREQSGKTLTAIAVATRMAIEKNCKILLISTSIDDPTLKTSFWGNERTEKLNLFNTQKSTIAVEDGMEGLMKLATSKKLEPAIITDYTRVIFKERLEVIEGISNIQYASFEEKLEVIKKIEKFYVELIKTASLHYDVVIVDVDRKLSKQVREDILNVATVNAYVLSQKLDSIERFKELKKEKSSFIKDNCIPVIGKYDKAFKYNSKNIARYLGEKKEFNLLPRNLLYMGAVEEAGVTELFYKLKNVKDKTDENYIFMDCILNLTNAILNKVQEMQRLR